MKEVVLLTGASSGIGYEMAKLLAKEEFDLILVARRINRLDQLKHEIIQNNPVAVHTFQVDLSIPGNAEQLYHAIKDRCLRVSALINNAGFGAYGKFTDLPLDVQVGMVNVNITALMILSRLFLADMKADGYGRLMNMASLLSYLPFPYYSVYSATKAFVLSFTETLAAEYDGTGIEIKALCPGPVATDFNTAGMLNTNAYESNKPIPATDVATAAVKHLLYGRGSKKVGFLTWFISNLPRITPDRIMMKIKKRLASQRNGHPVVG